MVSLIGTMLLTMVLVVVVVAAAPFSPAAEPGPAEDAAASEYS